jgi:hypothetical protein
MEFYSFRHRKRVDIPDENLRKRRYESNGGHRYAIFGSAIVEGQEAKVSKFISKADFETYPYPEVKA